MASTAHKEDWEIKEHYDDPASLSSKLDTLADWVRESKRFSAFTGAGISTAAGLPDFRGPDGIWTKRAQGRGAAVGCHTRDFLSAQPTVGHMALVALHQQQILKTLISTNTDGMHLRSGFPRAALTELHGNTNLEECVSEPIGACTHQYGGDGCGAEYFRDERVRPAGLRAHEHATGRKCECCGGDLQDTIINFNENLRARNVSVARNIAKHTDIMLTLGSSLRVSAWAPEMVSKRRDSRLVVCNLQWTSLDDHADLKIYARTDAVLAGLCSRLGVTIPTLEVRRRLTIDVAPCGNAQQKLIVHATDSSGAVPYAYLTRVDASIDGAKLKGSGMKLPGGLAHTVSFPLPPAADATVKLIMHTASRFNEPPFEVSHPIASGRAHHNFSSPVPRPSVESLQAEIVRWTKEMDMSKRAGDMQSADELERHVQRLAALLEKRQDVAMEAPSGLDAHRKDKTDARGKDEAVLLKCEG